MNISPHKKVDNALKTLLNIEKKIDWLVKFITGVVIFLVPWNLWHNLIVCWDETYLYEIFLKCQFNNSITSIVYKLYGHTNCVCDFKHKTTV